jgi:hypothetical protein
MDLRREIESEIESYSEREKKQCYKVFIMCDGTESFISKENAVNSLIDSLELFKDCTDYEFPQEISPKVSMMTDSDIERYCKDYNKE